VDGDADDDDEEPQSKRSRSSRNSLRISLDKSAANNNNNNNNNNTSNQNNNRRSGRRTNDNLPLNSAALYCLLEQTMKHQAAWPFLRPVLPSEVPDYHKIIKSPMDLAKIKSKLNMGDYQLNEELLSDIQLVFKNCDLYNVRGNEIYEYVVAIYSLSVALICMTTIFYCPVLVASWSALSWIAARI